jgi:hypothetical protein
MKREIPILLTVLCGLAITWAFFSPTDTAKAVNAELLAWAEVIFSVAFLLGITNLVRISLKQISAGHPDAIYKVLLLIALFGYLAVGLADIHGVLVPEGAAAKARTDWINEKFFQPLQSTMFSLLAFYIASAAFRAFRARSLEATLLLVAGTLVMLGQVPMPTWLPEAAAVGTYLQRVQAFLLVYVNGAGQSAIIIGAALGTLATGLRIILGVERSYLSE